jgi:hypothetical protein
MRGGFVCVPYWSLASVPVTGDRIFPIGLVVDRHSSMRHHVLQNVGKDDARAWMHVSVDDANVSRESSPVC